MTLTSSARVSRSLPLACPCLCARYGLWHARSTSARSCLEPWLCRCQVDPLCLAQCSGVCAGHQRDYGVADKSLFLSLPPRRLKRYGMVKYFRVTRSTNCDEYEPFPRGKTCGPSDKDLSKVSEYPSVTVKRKYVGKELEILNEFTKQATIFYDSMPVLKKTLKPTTRFSKNDKGPCYLSTMACDNALIDWYYWTRRGSLGDGTMTAPWSPIIKTFWGLRAMRFRRVQLCKR